MSNVSLTSLLWIIISFLIIYLPSYTIVNGSDVFTVYYYEHEHLLYLIVPFWNFLYLNPIFRNSLNLPTIEGAGISGQGWPEGCGGNTLSLNIVFCVLNALFVFISMLIGFVNSELPNLLVISLVNIIYSIFVAISIYKAWAKEVVSQDSNKEE